MYFGANIVPSFEMADVLGAIDDPAAGRSGVEESGIAGMHPAVRRHRFARSSRVLAIADEHARRAELTSPLSAMRDLTSGEALPTVSECISPSVCAVM